MSHHHHEGHNHHHHGYNAEISKRFVIAIAINLIYVIAEFYLGYRYDSVGLLADAGHNLSDIFGMGISLVAFLMLKKSSSETFTYGFRKATVLASFLNSIFLIVAIGLIIYECIEKFAVGSVASGGAIMVTASIGIVINGMTVVLLSAGKERDINIKSAYLHMLADTLVSVGVVASGGLIMLTNMYWIDPVVGLTIAGIIIYSSWELFRDSFVLVLDGVPNGIDVKHLHNELLDIPNVDGVHHIHIWPLSTTENALTGHVVLRDVALIDDTKDKIKDFLKQHNIQHSTLEFESIHYCCAESC